MTIIETRERFKYSNPMLLICSKIPSLLRYLTHYQPALNTNIAHSLILNIVMILCTRMTPPFSKGKVGLGL